GELVGAQLRASREQLLAGQAAAASHAPPATATINATRAPKTTPIATPAVSASIVPTATDPVVSPAASPLAEPSGVAMVLTGTVTGANISMLRSVTVGGRVLGRDGVSVPNAQVSLSKMFGGIQYPLSGGVTDRTGGFTLTTVAMPMTLAVQASGRTTPAWTTIDLDVRGDRTDLVATIDRGNIVTGTLRDASGRALADTDFGASPSDAQVSCLSCTARTDAAGHFALTLPSATIRFQTWAQPTQ